MIERTFTNSNKTLKEFKDLCTITTCSILGGVIGSYIGKDTGGLIGMIVGGVVGVGMAAGIDIIHDIYTDSETSWFADSILMNWI